MFVCSQINSRTALVHQSPVIVGTLLGYFGCCPIRSVWLSPAYLLRQASVLSQSLLSPFLGLYQSCPILLIPSEAHCATRVACVQFRTGWRFVAVSFQWFFACWLRQVTPLNTFVSSVEASTEKVRLDAVPESENAPQVEA